MCVKQHRACIRLISVSCIFDIPFPIIPAYIFPATDAGVYAKYRFVTTLTQHSVSVQQPNVLNSVQPRIHCCLKNTKFCFSPHTSSASLHIWLITMPVLATKVHSDHRISLFSHAESSQSETVWLAGLTRTEQMIMLLRRRRKTGPVNCARSSTSRQQRLVMPASPPDGRVSEFCFTPPEINEAPSWPC